MNKLKLIILIGNVGTGKSTFAKVFFGANPEFEIISSDEIQREFSNKGERGIREEINEIFKKKLEQNIKDKNVIIDNPNMSPMSRQVVIKNAKYYNPNIEVIAIDFGIGSEDTLSRRAEELKHLSLDKWREIHLKNIEEYKTPDKWEGFDKILTLSDH